jgi:hypothetical protein
MNSPIGFHIGLHMKNNQLIIDGVVEILRPELEPAQQ